MSMTFSDQELGFFAMPKLIIDPLYPQSNWPKSSSWKRVIALNVIAINIALVMALGTTMQPAHCQQKEALQSGLPGDAVLQAWGENSEVRKCGICHYVSGNAFARRDTDFCQLDEAQTWLQSDKHAVSRLRIEPLSQIELDEKKKEAIGDLLGESNLVSFRLCQQLGYDLATEKGYDQFRDNCLTCHAGYDPKQLTASDDFAKSNSHHPGISCNYCHQRGEASRWVDLHGGLSNDRPWRLLSPAQKEEACMRDLMDAPSQAKLCTTCHIGDHERRMFITHEMYVAGHPPLPSFELQTYLSTLPPHWRNFNSTYASLEGFSQRAEYFAVNLAIPNEDIPQVMEDTFWETRTLLLGAMQAAEQSIALMADANPNQHWGDYALYDCASCHHELRLPSFRQQRAAHDVPGRPRLPEWPTPLIEVALQLEHPASGVKEARGNLLSLINQTPFGNPKDCLPAARVLSEALKRSSVQLTRSSIEAEQARQVVKLLAHTSDDALLDYHAARQTIWAIQLVDRELAAKGHALRDSTRAAIEQLGTLGQQSVVSTELPAGRSGTLYTPAQATPGKEPLSYLAAELERVREYDPQKIRTQMRELCTQLD